MFAGFCWEVAFDYLGKMTTPLGFDFNRQCFNDVFIWGILIVAFSDWAYGRCFTLAFV